MLVRIYFDAGRSWTSLYFSDVSEEQAEKIKSAFRFNSLPRCWQNAVVSEKDNVLEIRADFHYRVRFDCLKKSGDNRDAWREKVREMNKGIMAYPKEQMVNVMLQNEARAKLESCVHNFKDGKCKNPFVVQNLGCVLLPHLYKNKRQK